MKFLTTSLLVLGLLASCGRNRSNNNNTPVNGFGTAAQGARWFQNCQMNPGVNNYQFGNAFGNPYAFGGGFSLGFGVNPYMVNPYMVNPYGVGMNPFNAACP